MRRVIGALAALRLALDLPTGDNVGEKSQHRGDREQPIASGAREESHGQPEIRRQAATGAVQHGGLTSVNMVAKGLHGA